MGLCLDGFCIGQSINDARFNAVDWVAPRDTTKEQCRGIACQPQIAFRGYPERYQGTLADAVSWMYGLGHYNIIRKDTLPILRHYRYECNLSARPIQGGERRFFGLYLSVPSRYLTVIGLRLIDGELRVYRIARQYPYHNPGELISLAKTSRSQFGDGVVLYDYLSSNVYHEVAEKRKNGWFGRSTMFNPTDLSDNAAELVLIDPRTRSLLEPSSMPESGEIAPLPMKFPAQCSEKLSIQ